LSTAEKETERKALAPTLAELKESLGAVSPAEAIPFLNLLIYGDPGAGKTHLCGTAQESKHTAPVLFFDLEGGTTTIRHQTDVSVVRVTSYEELWNHLSRLNQLPKLPFGTIIVDSLTELQKIDLANMMRKIKAADSSRDEEVPSIREWGKSGVRMRNIVRRLRDMKCNTILTALAQTKRDTDGSVSTMPDFSGKLAADIPGFMDIVAYLYVDVEKGETERRLLCSATKRYMAKDRTGSLGTVVVNPTFPSLWDKIVA